MGASSPIIVFTDGAAKGNPGPGGWGAIVLTPDQHVTELGGGSPHTTNNRMELSGAIAALQHVANRAVLAAGIHPLQQDQQRLGGIGIKQLLKLSDSLA